MYYLRTTVLNAKSPGSYLTTFWIWKQSVKNLSQNEAHRVHNLLIEFQSAFAANEMDIGLFKGITHKVNTGDAQAVRAKLRRLPLCFVKEEETHLKKLLENGVIVSKPFLVRKKDGTVRYCVYLRKVNSLTKKETFPLPNIEECMDSFCKHISFGTRLIPNRSGPAWAP